MNASFANSQMLPNALRVVTVPCLATDRQERLLFINQAYLDLCERPGGPDDYLGMTLGEFHYSDPNHMTVLGQCMHEAQPLLGLQLESRTWAGAQLLVTCDVAPLIDETGQVVGAFAAVLDSTRVKRQEEDIALLAAFPREDPNPVVAVNQGGEPGYANPAALRLLHGAGLDDVAGLLPGRYREIVAACLASGQNRLDVESSAGGRVFSWTFHPLRGMGLVHLHAVDITARKRMEQQLHHDAMHDVLTGLPNRGLLLDRLRQILKASFRRTSQNLFAVMLLDLDRFKHVNDSLGHAAGDMLLTELARRVERLIRPEDTLARLGGDEFALLFDCISSTDQSLVLAHRIHEALAPPFYVEGAEIFVTASIGVAPGPRRNALAEDLLRDADVAMYRAKAKGKATSVVFDPSLHLAAQKRLALEIDLKRAVDDHAIEVFYQPIVCLGSRRICGFEALARWRRNGTDFTPPEVFIPVAEETGLIGRLGESVLGQACREAAHWLEFFPADQREPILSVNVSVRQLWQPSFADDVAQALAVSGLPACRLQLEITESDLVDRADKTMGALSRLKAMGLTLSIDDFGTGCSSLSYLHRFPFDCLKVDRSFVSAMAAGNESLEIVRTIVSLAHSLGKQTIAEGVERQAQALTLLRLGCEYGQGYLFSRPVPPNEARALIESGLPPSNERPSAIS